MRIIAGSLKGREFKSPRGHKTHPMSEKIRGALFNALGDIEGLSVLDAFAGTGALAYEAISRGAASALAIEHDNEAYKQIAQNIRALSLDAKITALRTNNKGWSKNNPEDMFDIVLLDPPYNDFKRDVLQHISTHAKPGGTVVLSWPGSEPAPPLEGLEVLTTKAHGGAQLVFYRKTA